MKYANINENIQLYSPKRPFYDDLSAGWTRVWNDEQKVPYAYHGDQWVGYDDLQSIEIKVSSVCINDTHMSVVNRNVLQITCISHKESHTLLSLRNKITMKYLRGLAE
jgi:chitinase